MSSASRQLYRCGEVEENCMVVIVPNVPRNLVKMEGLPLLHFSLVFQTVHSLVENTSGNPGGTRW